METDLEILKEIREGYAGACKVVDMQPEWWESRIAVLDRAIARLSRKPRTRKKVEVAASES